MRHFLFLCLALAGCTIPVQAEVVRFPDTSQDFILIAPGSAPKPPQPVSAPSEPAPQSATIEHIAATLAPSWMRAGAPIAAGNCQTMRRVFPGASSASARRRERFRNIIENAACDAGIPVDLLDALIMQESRYRAGAISHAGAIGLAQLMPGTARDLGVTNPRDPNQNVRAGARYLRAQFDTFGSIPLALAAYNAGPGAVRKYGGIPPFRETRGYVRTIAASLASFPDRSRRIAKVVTLAPHSRGVQP